MRSNDWAMLPAQNHIRHGDCIAFIQEYTSSGNELIYRRRSHHGPGKTEQDSGGLRPSFIYHQIMRKQAQTAGNNYQRIARAIAFIQENVTAQPSLDEVAAHIGLSPYHFQRLFRQWAGVSPKRFLEYLTVHQAKRLLDNAKSILDVSLEMGLSSPARLHDQFVCIEAITPGQYKSMGKNLEIRYGFHPAPFGEMFLARTDKGICTASFVDGSAKENEIHTLKKSWPDALMIQDQRGTAALSQSMFNGLAKPDKKFHLAVRGTNFQIKVWQALLKIPGGRITSYQAISDMIGKPDAARATANAIAANPVAFLIPCHRVLRSTGALSSYRWGQGRKQLMLAWEMAREDRK